MSRYSHVPIVGALGLLMILRIEWVYPLATIAGLYLVSVFAGRQIQRPLSNTRTVWRALLIITPAVMFVFLWFALPSQISPVMLVVALGGTSIPLGLATGALQNLDLSGDPGAGRGA
jgi:hypothetical protein